MSRSIQLHNSGSLVARRTVLAAIGAAAFAGIPEFCPALRARAPDALQAWLAAAAIPVRTVDPSDEDFADLEPLAAAIGSARVVQLGEPSHNAGTCFAAKVRLIKFLHQRMGFDVVIWESGLYDVELVEAGLRVGEDPVTAAQRGILRNWSASMQCRPLFVYARGTHTTGRPLTMAGFDSTLTSPFAHFAADLRVFAGMPHNANLKRETTGFAIELIEAFGAVTAYVEALNDLNAKLTVGGDERQQALAKWERETGAALRPNQAMLQRFEQARHRLAELLSRKEHEFARAAGLRRTGFMRRMVDSLGARAANLYARFGTDVPPSSEGGLAEQNRRDACNAENLRWLIEQGYPGRKLIVWAHNAHVMNAYYEAPEWKTVRLQPAANTMKPSGAYLAQWLGSNLYTIGCTAYEGDDGWEGLSSEPIPPARADSIEDRVHRLGQRYAFVDLRPGRARGHPLQNRQVMRVPKYDEIEIADPAQPYDGLLFIDLMERASLIPA